MAYINVTLPEGESVCTGKQVTFRAPCNCDVPEGIQIGNVQYTLKDAACTSLVGSRAFAAGAMVSVILDVDNNSAYLINGKGSAAVALLPPTDLAAVPGDTEVSLTWTNPSDVVIGSTTVAHLDHIEIKRDGVVVATVNSGTTYTDEGLNNDTTYVYKVVAVTSDNEKTESTSVSVTTASGYSIEKWCETAGLSYTELSDIPLSDLKYLMRKHTSVDYLLTWYAEDSTMFADFVASENVMKAIGLSDYACDNMFTVSGMKSALLGSTYWEYILKDKVPTMTSNITPKGTCGSTSIHTSGSYQPYMAFDNNVGTFSNSTASPTGAILYYTFDKPILVNKISLTNTGGANNLTRSFTLVGANTVGTWEDIQTFTSDGGVSETREFVATNSKYYMTYGIRLNSYSGTVGTNTWAVAELQFYGRSLSVSVPTMTSNTTPYGEAFSASVFQSGYEAYKAFCGSDNLAISATGGANGWYIGYKYDTKINVGYVSFSYNPYRLWKYKIQSSNNGTTWEDITTVQLAESTSETRQNTYTTFNSVNAQYFRLVCLDNKYIHDGQTNYGWCDMSMLQFYGVDYSETPRTTEISLTVEGAQQDNITITDASGTTVGLAVISSGCSTTVQLEIIDGEDYTFTSSVAKATDGSGSDYAKTITLTNSTESLDDIVIPLVPTMTSNTTPSGEVIGSSEANTERAKFHAFDNNGANSWWTATASTLGWVGYKFTNPTNVNRCIVERLAADVGVTSSVVVEASNDLSQWVAISEETPIVITSVQANNKNVINFNNNNYYIAYRVRFTSNSSNYCSFCTVQFYTKTKGVKVMPSGALEWYGNPCSSANTDFVSNSCFTFTRNTNSLTVSRGNTSYAESRRDILLDTSDYTKLKVMVTSVTYKNEGLQITAFNSSGSSVGNAFATTSGKYEITLSSIPTQWRLSLAKNESANVSCVWLE